MGATAWRRLLDIDAGRDKRGVTEKSGVKPEPIERKNFKVNSNKTDVMLSKFD